MNFERDGYEVVDMFKNGIAIVEEARAKLTELIGDLDSYHERVPHENLILHAEALEVVKDIPRRVIESELRYFQMLLGPDLHIQQVPFLRISRPFVKSDNIGFHRDTWYGDTPYEISVWIPLTDTDEGNALALAKGSHVWAEEADKIERVAGSVAKGSAKHALGFIHSEPKRLRGDAAMVTPLPVKVGQMVVFSLAMLHGQEMNRSTRTRFSMDCRLTNSMAPVKHSRSRNPDYYERLCAGPVMRTALKYYEAQK